MAKLTEEQKAANKESRRLLKEKAEELARIQAEVSQQPVSEITFGITWKKARSGHVAYCEAKIRHKDGQYSYMETKAGGYGYDKESTVIAEVFNQYLKYKLYRPLKPTDRDEKRGSPEWSAPYGIYLGDHKYYSGGIGTNCYYAISEAINGKFEHIFSGKNADVYKYTDNESI